MIQHSMLPVLLANFNSVVNSKKSTNKVSVYKKFYAMCCRQKQAGSGDVLVGFMFQWDFLVIVDMTEQRSTESDFILTVMSQSGGRA